MSDPEAFYRNHLKNEFQKRKASNSRYSLRAFAMQLGVDNGQLSRIMSGKEILSVDLADKIAKKLKLLGETRAEFLMSCAEEQKCRALYLVDPSLTDCDEDE